MNHTDVWIRRGYEGDLPVISGIDVTGEIAAVGAGVDEFEDMLGGFFAGDIEPVINQVITLEGIPGALERLEASEGFGKIIAQR